MPRIEIMQYLDILKVYSSTKKHTNIIEKIER